MSTVSGRDRRDSVARFHHGLEGSDVGDRSRNRLDVGKIGVEDLLGQIDANGFDGVEIVATLVVPLPGQALRIPAVKIAVTCTPDHRGDHIFTRDHWEARAIVRSTLINGVQHALCSFMGWGAHGFLVITPVQSHSDGSMCTSAAVSNGHTLTLPYAETVGVHQGGRTRNDARGNIRCITTRPW